MTLPVLSVVGTVLLLAAWTSAQIQPCDPLNSSGGSEFQTLFVSVEEASALALTQAQQSGSMDKYRGRIEISGRINDNIQLTLQDQNGRVGCLDKFSIVTGSTPDVFYLQLKAGVDRDGATASTLDDLVAYYCTIQCNTAGRNTIFLPVTITIKDINDNPPAFVDAPYSRTVNELTPIGTTVFRRISATDKDGEGNKEVDFTFTSSVGTPGADKFAIDLPRQGFVTVSATLDFETLYYQYQTDTYNLTIMGKDTGTPSLSATTQLVITLEDGDDLGPMFVYTDCITHIGLYPICIEPELTANVISNTVPAGGIVQTYPLTGRVTDQPVAIRARDQDTLNAAIAFSLESTDFSTYFSLSTPTKDSVGGVDFYEVNLIQQQAIDRTITKEFFLIIRAEEQTTNRRFATTRISVTVSPSNRFAPTLSTNTIAFTGYVQENAQVGTMVTNQARDQVLKLTVLDQDVTAGDSPGTYDLSIVGPSPFAVSSDGFVSVASSVLDYETTRQYTPVVMVRETDTTDRLSSSVTLTINVLDMNDYAPVFPQGGYSSSIPARDYSTAGSRQVTTVLATDSDSGLNGQITYSITSVTNGGAGKFAISDIPNNNGATVNVIGSVTRGEQYALTIRATDKATVGKLSGETVLVVDVVADGNTPPQIGASRYDVFVSEGVPVDSRIFSIPATDEDGNSLSYLISSGNLAGDFAISASGEITNIDTLDRETIASYSLVVLVRDNASPQGSASTTVSIFVTDINDNSPRFSPSTYRFSVQEGLADVLVGTVTATDADQQNTDRSAITYPPLASSKFRIESDTGNILHRVGLDYETERTHILTVVASDLASDVRSSTVSVTISVVDVADYVPRFVPVVYQAVVPENQANLFCYYGGLLLIRTPRKVWEYKFLTGDHRFFSLQSDGTIRTAQALDYETINDQTTFPPVIGSIPGGIIRLESAPVGNELVQVTATDGDPTGKLPFFCDHPPTHMQFILNTDNSRIRYSIVSVNPVSGGDLFYIGPESGRLVIRSPLTSDANRPSQYQISIQAEDLGTPPLTGNSVVTLVVQRNRYAPVFSPSSFSKTIQHTFPVGSEVLSVKAYDNDTVVRLAYAFHIRHNGFDY
ncbi:cadherin-99C-like [Liolophura sinensis]|uniref:cadherin-99C-like n=1 Tax=Liolophura sinensis TaxID=3198878 RepID=UPI0031582EBD